jgi:hypothetical protein
MIFDWLSSLGVDLNKSHDRATQNLGPNGKADANRSWNILWTVILLVCLFFALKYARCAYLTDEPGKCRFYTVEEIKEAKEK